MVVFSFNSKRAVKAAVVTVCAVFLVVLCVIIAMEKKTAVPEYATADEIGRYFTEAADTEMQEEFLEQFGIKVDTKSKTSDKIIIPKSFDDVYEEYNGLQKLIGLDLSPFKGGEANRVVYKMKDKEKYVTLLIFKGHVIGGHLSTGIYGDGYEALNGKTG